MRVTILVLALTGCAPPPAAESGEGLDYNELNAAAGDLVLYELQARSANACHPDDGSPAQRAACAAKIAPTVRAQPSCAIDAELRRIALGTLDDLLDDTADPKQAITIRYLDERLGANGVWLMPLFPDNDRWSLPDACDNLGSPYAVRDYLHAAGSLSRACIAAGRDEESDPPCFADDVLDRVIAEAHRRGMKVLLDVALNHFGHNYLFSDTAGHRAVRDRLPAGENLWDFGATFDAALVHPVIAGATGADADAVHARCPQLSGAPLARAAAAWHEAFDWERASFACDAPSLEYQLPAFYLGRDAWNPSSAPGDNFSNNWVDVKFLYHQESNGAHAWEFARVREYLFRVLNHWLARGADGFRLDHTTDWNSGMAPNEWKYITSKLDYYAWRRGQPRPIFLAEEFGDQLGMSRVSDIMTEGYVGDLTGRNGQNKDSGFVAGVLANSQRFAPHTFVMTALETHDEKRLTDGTGFDEWTGAGFWGLGATMWSTPMLLSGQELGEGWQLSFRRSDYLRSRFAADDRGALVDFYAAMIRARKDPRNRALKSRNWRTLPTRDGSYEPRLYVAAKWSDDGNVLFVAHNLWEQDVAQSYYLPADLAQSIALDESRNYR
ncbi:MAG TPA: hypothetical protein VFF06_12735, partial [Polyangia bacterium]|nr:hypothetical protein [Polyangia bacterium]